jgi:hypothetical protein
VKKQFFAEAGRRQSGEASQDILQQQPLCNGMAA